MRVERQISSSVGRFTIAFSRKLTVVLTTDCDIQIRYFLVCYSFNRKLDRWLDLNIFVLYLGVDCAQKLAKCNRFLGLFIQLTNINLVIM